MLKRMKDQKGFTLIELIVVLAILAILAAVAIPRFAGVQDRAKVNADISNAKMIGNAAETALVEGKITTASAYDAIKTALITTDKYIVNWPTPTAKTGVFNVVIDSDVVHVYYRTVDGEDTDQISLYPTAPTAGTY